MIDPCHIWNVIYNARSNRGVSPTSPNTAPATQNDSHETSFTLRGVTEVFLQHHRILRLPHKMTLMIDPHDIWNVIYNARSNRCHPPTSPNTAPATKNDSLTFHRNFSKTAEASFTMRDRSENDPTMIQEWNRHSATRLATEATFRARREHFVLKNTTFRAPATIPHFTKCCTCLKKWRLNFTKYCTTKYYSSTTLYYKVRSSTTPVLLCATPVLLSWLILVTFTIRGATEVFLQHHRILRLPRKMSLTFHRNFSKTAETSFTIMRDRSENDPSMTRTWTRMSAIRLAT